MDKKIITRAALGIAILLSSFWFSAALAAAINDGPAWLSLSIWSLLGFFVLLIAAAQAYLIEENIWFLYGAGLAILLPFLFFLKADIFSLFAILAFFLLLFGARRANFEKLLRLNFAPMEILRRGFGPAITGLAIMSALVFYGAPAARNLGDDIIVPRPLFEAIAGSVIDFSLQLTLPPGSDLDSLPSDFAKARLAFMDTLYNSLSRQIDIAKASFGKWIPFGAAIGLFFVFKIVGIFLSWPVMALAWLVFRMLLWSGVVKIEKVAAEKEIIRI